jgi:hypothetical protein
VSRYEFVSSRIVYADEATGVQAAAGVVRIHCGAGKEMFALTQSTRIDDNRGTSG